MDNNNRLSDEERAQLEAAVKRILNMGQKPKTNKKISEKEELLAAAYAMAELEKIREAFIEFQESISKLTLVQHVSPAIIDFADYCHELQRLFMNISVEEAEDIETKNVLTLGRDAILASIIETLKQKGKI
ncbi:MAG TPA: hypothetical protein VK190_02765 [Pseudoneobacillus sp.]|nr:hypothetical protein [Pseudoneobacillus sp.]